MLDFGQHAVPNELQEFYRFAETMDDYYLDFEFIEPSKEDLAPLLRGKEENFLAFAMDGTGSYLAYWFYENNLSIEQAPIVFLNSEGGGIVLAKSATEFLALLPYDTAFFAEVAIYWEDYQEYPQSTIPPEQAFSQDKIAGILERMKERYEAYDQFTNWLSSQFNINAAENPYKIITENAQRYPALPF